MKKLFKQSLYKREYIYVEANGKIEHQIFAYNSEFKKYLPDYNCFNQVDNVPNYIDHMSKHGFQAI